MWTIHNHWIQQLTSQIHSHAAHITRERTQFPQGTHKLEPMIDPNSFSGLSKQPEIVHEVWQQVLSELAIKLKAEKYRKENYKHNQMITIS
jgi:hypothetical protein